MDIESRTNVQLIVFFLDHVFVALPYSEHCLHYLIILSNGDNTQYEIFEIKLFKYYVHDRQTNMWVNFACTRLACTYIVPCYVSWFTSELSYMGLCLCVCVSTTAILLLYTTQFSKKVTNGFSLKGTIFQ